MVVMIADCSTFVKGVKVTFFNGDENISEIQVPEINGETLASLAKDHDAQRVFLRGNDKYVSKLREEMLTKYSNLNIEIINC